MSKKVLVVTAHPSSHGLTHRIAESYKRGAESVGAEVEILDLYKTDLKQDFLRFENIHDIPTDQTKATIQQKITDADELVFVHPLWWMGPPAILRNFIDINFSSHFAFRYEERGRFSIPKFIMGGGRRIGMLKGKTACVFITCDGSILLYIMMALPFWSIWRFGTLFYCGIKTRAFRLLDRKTIRPESDWNKFLTKVEKIGRGVGK